mgnify:CR=1 FL=1
MKELRDLYNKNSEKTELTYINGSLGGKTQMSINAVTAGSGTVIMGDVTIANKEFVKISYDASTLTTMQQLLPKTPLQNTAMVLTPLQPLISMKHVEC